MYNLKSKLKAKLRLSLLSLFSLVFIACGGGGGSSGSVASSTKSDTAEQEISVTVKPIEGLQLEAKNHIITIDDKSSPYSSSSSTTIVKAKPSDITIATLSTEFGEPILISYSNTNNKQTELSVESSADVFVMRSPRFYGIKITDIQELSKRIRAHLSYSELLSELSERIKNSPCPMDSSCSAIASSIAEKIAQDISFLDLIDKGVVN